VVLAARLVAPACRDGNSWRLLAPSTVADRSATLERRGKASPTSNGEEHVEAMIMQMTANLAIDAKDQIGEGPAWDAAGRRFVWSDNATGIIHEAKADGVGGWRETQQWNLDRPVGAAVPRANGGFVVAGGVDIFFLHEDGSTEAFARLDADPDRVLINDAKCDPQGRLWAGTRSRDFTPGEAALFRIDPNGAVVTVLEDVSLSNGLDWSPDGSVFYYIDTVPRTLDAFNFDAATGTISNRRNVITVEFGHGMPDGMAVDREGCLWVAIIGSGVVQRYAPSGALLARIGISTPAVTSCAFGGDDGGDLLITSIGRRLPDALLQFGCTMEMLEGAGKAPGAGGVFVCRPGVTGAPASQFAG
jgi:sugar lactone lactonase YvrE